MKTPLNSAALPRTIGSSSTSIFASRASMSAARTVRHSRTTDPRSTDCGRRVRWPSRASSSSASTSTRTREETLMMLSRSWRETMSSPWALRSRSVIAYASVTSSGLITSWAAMAANCWSSLFRRSSRSVLRLSRSFSRVSRANSCGLRVLASLSGCTGRPAVVITSASRAASIAILLPHPADSPAAGLLLRPASAAQLSSLTPGRVVVIAREGSRVNNARCGRNCRSQREYR